MWKQIDVLRTISRYPEIHRISLKAMDLNVIKHILQENNFRANFIMLGVLNSYLCLEAHTSFMYVIKAYLLMNKVLNQENI